jgi:hypothetical protein
MRPGPSAPVHPRPWRPEARSRANPGSGGRPTDTARIVHGPCFHSEARLAQTGARQDPCSGGRAADTTGSYPWLSIEAWPCRTEPCPRSHTRAGCRPPDAPRVRPSQADTAGGQGEGQTRDSQDSALMDPCHGWGVGEDLLLSRYRC